MKKALLTKIILLALVVGACSRKGGYEKNNDGIIVRLDNTGGKQARLLKLEVIADKIIHVTATPSDSFSTEKSLVVLPGAASAPAWSTEEADDAVTLVTSSLRARVSLLT